MILQTATLYPGIVFGLGFLLNLFVWGKHSSGAVRDMFDIFPSTLDLMQAFATFAVSLGTFHDYAGPPLSMVRDLLSPHLLWLLLWLPQASIQASCTDQSDSSTDSGAAMVS